MAIHLLTQKRNPLNFFYEIVWEIFPFFEHLVQKKIFVFGGGQFWQCKDFGSARHCMPSIYSPIVGRIYPIPIYKFNWRSFPNVYICIWYKLPTIREGCTNKNPEKVWSFAKPPSAPPSTGLAFFQKKIYPNLLLKIASLMAETNFTLGPTSKTNKFNLLFLVIVGQNSQHKRANLK